MTAPERTAMTATTSGTDTAQVDVDAVVRRAHAALAAGADETPARRASWLTAVAQALTEHEDELVAVAEVESRLPLARLHGELARTVFQLRLLADEVRAGVPLDATVDHADPGWGMGPRPDLRRVNVPLGVVAVFGASNFPFAFSVAGGDSASALAAGCSVVHKVHEAHPRLGELTGRVVVEALDRAGAPAGLFATVAGRDAGTALVDHPLVAAVGFTGSTRVGRLLLDRAAARPVPVPFFGELGSTNPVFVTPAAWAARGEELVAGFVASFTLGTGQFCTKPGVLLLPRPGAADLDRLRAAVAAATVTPMLTAGLAQGFLAARSAVAARPGVEVVVPGGDGDAPAPALLMTSVAHVRRDPGLLDEEVFGPASLLVQYDDEAELLEAAALLTGQLTATVHAEADDDVAGLVRVLSQKAGRVVLDGWPTGVTVSHAQHHGGPFPATTAPSTTSVGTAAVRRWVRPVAYQGFADERLPASLQEHNPWGIRRLVDGRWQLPEDTP